MAEKLYSHILELLEPILKPRSLIVVLCVVSGGLLWDVFGVTTSFGVTKEVDDSKFYLLLVFFISAGIIAAGAVSWFILEISSLSSSLRDTLKLRKLKLSKEADVLLDLLYSQQPDSVQLLSQHGAVRELRRQKLIRKSTAIYYEDFDFYLLTASGVRVSACRDRSFIKDIPEGDRLDFYREATGLSWHVTRPKNW